MVNFNPFPDMKKSLFIPAFLFASLSIVFSCSKEAEIEPTPTKEEPAVEAKMKTITVNVVSPETKTVFGTNDGTGYPIIWNSTGEVIKLVEVFTPTAGDPVISAYSSTGYTLSNENANAKFSADVKEKSDAGTYDYRIVYPASAYTDLVLGSYNDVSVVIPATQTPTPTSPDPAATLLYAESTGLSAQPSSTLDLSFNHISAYGKMTIKNASSVIGGGETIESISISVPAGGVYYYWSNGTTKSVTATKTDEIEVKTDNLTTTGDFDVWFACKPYSLAIGDVLTVKINTDADTYIRNITMPKVMDFVSGQVSTFSVNMSSAVKLIYSTEFNYTIVGSNFTGSSPIDGTDSEGTSWYITYGNWNGSNCAQLRVYNSGNFGTIYNGFDCSYVTNVVYDAMVSNTALKLNTYYSIDRGSNWIKVDNEKSLTTDLTTYNFVVSSTGAYDKVRIKFEVAGEAPTSGNYQLTVDNVQIYGKGSVLGEPSIVAANVTNVPSFGVTDAATTYTINNFTGADDIVATCDGTVVTSASVSSAGNVLYTVSPNYGTSSRSSGTITLTSPREGIERVITISQMGETFSVSTETVTILKDATSGTFTITTPSFGWATTVDVEDGMNLTLSAPTSGSADASAQTLTVNSTTTAAATEQTLGTVVIYRNGNTSDPQKKTVTIKKASSAVASSYSLVKSLTAGAEYLIVNTTDSKVATGALSSNTLQSASVVISGGNSITGNATIDTYTVTITALTGDDTGYYSLQFGSNYLGCKATGTDVLTNASVASDYYKWNISIDNETGLATITNKSRTDRFIGWNGSSSGWKAYSTSNYSTYPRPFLFKKN